MRRGSPMSGSSTSRPGQDRRGDDRERGGLDIGVTFAVDVIRHARRRRPAHCAGRRASGLRRAVRARADPRHPRAEGQEGRLVWEAQMPARCCLTIMAANVGLDPASDIEWVTSSIGDAAESFRRRQGRRLAGYPARAAGAARAQDRPRDPQHRHGPALVAVFLLHAVGQPRVSAPATRSRPSAPCAPSSRAADMCAADPRAAAQRLVDGGFAPRYDEALQTDERGALRQLARVRSRRTRCASTRCACASRA